MFGKCLSPAGKPWCYKCSEQELLGGQRGFLKEGQEWDGTWDRTLEAKGGGKEISLNLKRNVQGRKAL